MSKEVAQDQSCRHQSPLNAMDQLWNTESHACLDKHLNDPHYYTTIKKKKWCQSEPTDVQKGLQATLVSQNCWKSQAPKPLQWSSCSNTRALMWAWKEDWQNSPPSKVLPARQSSGSCGNWVAPDLLRCSAHMCSHASHTGHIHSEAKVQNRMFISLALRVYP